MALTQAQLERLPTQTIRPRAAAARTIIVMILGIIPIWQFLAHELGLESIKWVATSLAIATAVQRILTLPTVEILLQTYTPAISAAGAYQGKHRKDTENNNDSP